MHKEARKRRRVLAPVIVGAATLLALAHPACAPLRGESGESSPPDDPYVPGAPPRNIDPQGEQPRAPDGSGEPPGPGLNPFREALTDANLDTGFEPEEIIQFETATFTATVIYGSSIDPGLPRVKVAWSNEATLEAKERNTFEIEPTSLSRLFLEDGTPRADGTLELSWTWEVTPLVAGEQSLELHIVPTIAIDGDTVSEVLDVNAPIAVTVDVHPVQDDFDDVLSAAKAMEIDVPHDMTVGTEYPVSASMSLAGHSDTVSADIALAEDDGSAAVTIVDEGPAGGSPARTEESAASDASVSRHWTVTPDEPGQVSLLFTATVQGEVESHALEDDVVVGAAARATERGPSVWQALQQSVQYLTPFVAFAVALLGLWAAWKARKDSRKKRETVEDDPEGQPTAASRGDPAP